MKIGRSAWSIWILITLKGQRRLRAYVRRSAVAGGFAGGALLPEPEQTLGRLGGDEFIVLAEKPPRSAGGVGRAHPARLRQPFRIGLIEVYTGCSVGIALAPHHGEDRESLIRNADTAMYHAKENGRGQACVFSPEMNQRVFEYLWLDTNLRKALEHQQLIIHYQPKISEGGKVVGAEALVRWLSPERGMIPPNEFISYAEESGLIVPLGRWVMLTALQQIIAWRRGAFTCASR